MTQTIPIIAQGLTNAITLALPWVTQLVFIVAVGCSIGSLINVLVYRLPRGIGVVTPPSACPQCDTRLTWRENIPVLGWLLLRGRCRFCKNPISPEYPIVEAFTGLLFGFAYALWYLVPSHGTFLGVAWGAATPEWATNGLADSWPIALVALTALACLLAMTLVDAKTFTIPLVLAWVPAIVAVVALTLHALTLELLRGPFESYAASTSTRWFFQNGDAWRCAAGWLWSLPTPTLSDWRLIGISIGATAGLGVSLALVRFKLIGRSFDDYEAWEKKTLAEQEASGESADDADNPAMWVQYPHARREMIKELAFLGPVSILAMAGGWLVPRMVPSATDAPLWLAVLSGVLLGYLVGGGVVWAVRILGSLAFGKEAMGIGDVHLMAAVGACFGWIDAVLGFFTAAFVALAWAVLGAVVGGKVQRAMPFGPFLAVGAVLVFLGKPLFELLLTALTASPTPMDLP